MSTMPPALMLQKILRVLYALPSAYPEIRRTQWYLGPVSATLGKYMIWIHPSRGYYHTLYMAIHELAHAKSSTPEHSLEFQRHFHQLLQEAVDQNYLQVRSR